MAHVSTIRRCEENKVLVMQVTYDRETDTLTITLRDAKIQESDEVRPGVIADFDSEGQVVRFEILRASKTVEKTMEMQFAVVGSI